MPVAPPPPPPGPPPPPAGSLFSATAAASDLKGRDLLFKSIRAGTTLKKTVTNDRSTPLISGKTTNGGYNNNNNNNNNSNGPINRAGIQSGSATIARTNGLGALFADGIPKLKPTRTNIGQQQSQSSSLSSLPTANISSLHGNNNHVVKSVEIGRKAVATRNRGPPPQPPPLAQKPVLPTSVSESLLTPAGNTIGNHTRSQSTVSLQNGRVKPGLLPKPPAPAPPPPNKRGGGVSRAHSMRAPASPQIVPQGVPAFPTGVGGVGLGGTPMFHASTDSLIRGGIRPKPPLKAPTSRPPPPPRTAAPPPPAPIQPPPPPPPLPPHRAAPPLPFTVAPPPLPIRHSSMRNGNIPGEFESRFIFRSVKEFPAPPPFRNLNKIYNSKTVKAPAPAPPAIAAPQLQLSSSKIFARDSSNC